MKSYLQNILGGLLIALFPAALPLQAEQWNIIGEHLEKLEISGDSQTIVPSDLTFIRAAPSHHRVAVIRAREFGWKHATVKALAKKANAVATINANFFDPAGEPLGLVISRGNIFNNVHRGGQTLTGIFQVSGKLNSVLLRSDFNPDSISEAIQAGPRLLDKGVVVPGLRDNSSFSRRAGICLDKKGHIILFSQASGLSGISLEDLQRILLRPEIGCVDALNLDGGGSAQLYVSATRSGAEDNAQELWIEGRDEVPVALALFAREQQ